MDRLVVFAKRIAREIVASLQESKGSNQGASAPGGFHGDHRVARDGTGAKRTSLVTRDGAPDTLGVPAASDEKPPVGAEEPFPLRLFVLLCVATFFEGFDTKLASFVQPVIGAAFGETLEATGRALGLSSLGMVLAFFVIQQADRVGRRPVFLAGLIGYALFTLATAFAPNLTTFTVLQFFARMAMVVELGLGYLILAEEVPERLRGRASGVFASTAVLGAALPAALLAPLEAHGPGWRGLFVIGAGPLVLLPLYLRHVRETRAFRARPARSTRGEGGLIESIRRLWRFREARVRLVRVAPIWFAVNLWSGSALSFFTAHVVAAHEWTAADLQWLTPGILVFGPAGYLLAGYTMDRFGRRPAASLYLVAGFTTAAYCYGADDRLHVYLGYFLLFACSGIWTILMTWTAELFDVRSRATGQALANNLLGRMGLVFGPILVGHFAVVWNSVAPATVSISVGLLWVVPLVWTLPETRGHPFAEEEEDGPTKFDVPSA